MKQLFPQQTMAVCFTIAALLFAACAFEQPINLKSYRENGMVYSAEELPQAIADGKIGAPNDPLVSISVDNENVVSTKIYNEQAKVSLIRQDVPTAPYKVYYVSLSTYNKTLTKMKIMEDSLSRDAASRDF
jgi:hypothetical protein